MGEINSNYPKWDRISLIKRTTWILPQIVHDTPITGACTFYTAANKSGKAGYKPEDLSKPLYAFQKVELYAIFMVIRDIKKPLNIVTDSQYAERVVLHIGGTEFKLYDTELTSLFIQVRDIIRNSFCPCLF